MRTEPLRLLYLSNEIKEGDQRARRKIFADMVASAELAALEVFPYRKIGREQGWAGMMQHLLARSTAFRPDAIYWQGMTEGWIDDEVMEKIKALPSRPVFCNENGDPFGNFWVQPYPKALLQLCRHMDVCFNAGLGRMADYLKKHGAKRVYLLPHGYDALSFGADFPAEYRPEFDVVMIANRRLPRKPFAAMPGIRIREKVVRALEKAIGPRFAVFGSGWDGFASARGPVDFFRQHEVYHASRIALGLPNFFDIDYYESNRPFNAVSMGIPYVSGYSPKFDEILKAGVHCHYFRDADEAVEVVRELLRVPDDQRIERSRAAADYVRQHHTVRSRMRIIVKTMEAVRRAKQEGAELPPPITSFLAAEIEHNQQKDGAVPSRALDG